MEVVGADEVVGAETLDTDVDEVGTSSRQHGWSSPVVFVAWEVVTEIASDEEEELSPLNVCTSAAAPNNTPTNNTSSPERFVGTRTRVKSTAPRYGHSLSIWG